MTRKIFIFSQHLRKGGFKFKARDQTFVLVKAHYCFSYQTAVWTVICKGWIRVSLSLLRIKCQHTTLCHPGITQQKKWLWIEEMTAWTIVCPRTRVSNSQFCFFMSNPLKVMRLSPCNKVLNLAAMSTDWGAKTKPSYFPTSEANKKNAFICFPHV